MSHERSALGTSRILSIIIQALKQKTRRWTGRFLAPPRLQLAHFSMEFQGKEVLRLTWTSIFNREHKKKIKNIKIRNITQK
jgi:hypothetical protein